MTIVELFDEKPINNVVGAIAFHPDRIIYIGSISRSHFEKKKLPILQSYLHQKELSGIAIEYVQVRRDSLSDTVAQLESVYAENKDCKFHVEVTGGEELVLIALGILCGRHPDIEMYQISNKLRNIRSFSLDSEAGEKLDVECFNSVEEHLLLHGASIVTANGEDYAEGGLRWGLEFTRDFNEMWSICCKGLHQPSSDGPHLWNIVTGILAELDAMQEDRDERNSISINKHYFYNDFLRGNDELFHSYVYRFVGLGLMDYRIDEDSVTLDFKNDQIRMCLTKSGLLLELKTYLICLGLVHPRGGDCLTSVTIDWDGDEDLTKNGKLLTDPNDPDSTIDTINEVDVIATCGLNPYFISCKNGRFTSDELYKLYSVGEYFGKGCGKKILVAANLSGARNIIRQRALDMDIHIIENVHLMTDEEFSEELLRVMELPKTRKLMTV